MQINWKKFTLLLLPLVFIVPTLIHINESLSQRQMGIGLVGVLIFFNYSSAFFNRRVSVPTIFTLVLYYLLSLIGAVVIAYSGEAGWGVLVMILLRVVDAFTTANTPYGEEHFKRIENEKIMQKGLGKVFATPSQQSENLKGLVDFVVLIVVVVGFVLLENHYSVISNNQKIQESLNHCNSSKFIKFTQKDEIAMAKCYGKNHQLKYMNYYTTHGVLHKKFIFKDGKLDTIYDYYVFQDDTKYLHYKTQNIKKSDMTYVEEGTEFFYYIGEVTQYDYPSLEPEFTEKYYINYREDKTLDYFKSIN